MANYVPLTPVDGRGSRHSLQIVGVDTGPLNQIQGTPSYRAAAADNMTTLQNLASAILRAKNNATTVDGLFSSEGGGIKIDDSLRGVIESLIDGPFGGNFTLPGDVFGPDLTEILAGILQGALEGGTAFPWEEAAFAGLAIYCQASGGLGTGLNPFVKAGATWTFAKFLAALDEWWDSREEEEKKEGEGRSSDIWWPFIVARVISQGRATGLFRDTLND